MLYRLRRIETVCAVAVEQIARLAVCTFDREQPELSGNPAVRGEPADLTAGCEHAMARHDDRKRIASQCLSDRARRAAIPELRCDFSIGQRRTRRNPARHLVNPLVERRHAGHVEHDVQKIAWLATQQRNHVVDCSLHRRRRRRPLCIRQSLQQSRARLFLASFRQQETEHAALTPDDAATTHGRVEECVFRRLHLAGILAPSVRSVWAAHETPATC